MKTIFLKNPEAKVTALVFFSFLILHLTISLLYLNNKDILCQWDCKFYQSIMTNGYNEENAAFFPLFPWIWKILAFSTPLISLLNLVFYTIGLFFVLKSMEKTDPYLIILTISLSHFFYFMVPYTESLCFLGLSLFIYFNKTGKFIPAIIAIAVVTLTRPIFFILLGTFSAHIFWDFLTKKQFNYQYLIYILVTLCFLALYFFHLKSETSDFLAYFKARLAWQTPDQSYTFPLKLSLLHIGFFEVFALLLGFWGMFVMILTLINKDQFNSPIDFDAHAYVACFICAILLVQNGILSSLNRFILCSPFFLYLFGQKNKTINIKKYRNIFLGIIFIVLLCCWKEFPEHLLIIASLVFLNFSAYYFYTVKTNRIAIFVAIPANIVLQVVLFHHYLNGIWVS